MLHKLACHLLLCNSKSVCLHTTETNHLKRFLRCRGHTHTTHRKKEGSSWDKIIMCVMKFVHGVLHLTKIVAKMHRSKMDE